MRKKEKIVIISLILILIILIVIVSIRAYSHYNLWESRKNYFNQPNPTIQSWMTINTISEKFNINYKDIFRVLMVNETQINPHITLDRFCIEYNSNCPAIVNELNKLRRTK